MGSDAILCSCSNGKVMHIMHRREMDIKLGQMYFAAAEQYEHFPLIATKKSLPLPHHVNGPSTNSNVNA